MTLRRLLLALAIAVCLASCGNAVVVTPGEVAQNYVTDIANGNDSHACALLDGRARAALISTAGSHISCARLMARCLPARTTKLAKDQTQLLYANVDVSQQGGVARVALSATPVARSIREVTLTHAGAGWRLTSPGVLIARCARRERTRRHHRGRRHSR